MGHYDDMYEAEADELARREKNLAKRQLQAMEKFELELITRIGAEGIKKRHLEALEDMINATKVRAFE